MSHPAVSAAVDFLARSDLPSVRLHGARTLGSPRKFGSVRVLKEEAERDMFARDVRELFLLPYAEAWRTGRLRGGAADVVGPVLSRNASVALDAILARGCLDPSPPVQIVLDSMLERQHPRGFFFEPKQAEEVEAVAGTPGEIRYVGTTAAYVRYLVAFGVGRDERILAALDWLAEYQDTDGAWRPRARCHETESYLLTRRVVEAFAELPAPAMKRYGGVRRRLASAWAQRIVERCDDPDAVLPYLNIAPDPFAAPRLTDGPDLPARLHQRILYFPLEDLALAMSIGASAKHPQIAPWIAWLREAQLTDGSWRLRDPSLRERLLLSDPNGRLRAEALYLTDGWISLRAAQILRGARSRSRETAATRGA